MHFCLNIYRMELPQTWIRDCFPRHRDNSGRGKSQKLHNQENGIETLDLHENFG